MKQIEEYNLDELIALYKRLPIYATTWWFKYYRTYKMKKDEKDKPIISGKLNIKGYYSSPRDVRFFNDLRIDILDYDIEELMKKGSDHSKEIKRLQLEREAHRIMNESLFWFAGCFEQYVKDYDNTEDTSRMCRPEDLEEELHSNDDLNVEFGIATDYQVFEFVWETLQYLDIKQLSKLLKFADNGLAKKWENVTFGAGRKSRVGEIQQIEIETGEVVNTYTTRNELMEKTGIKKSHLAQCIKTAKDNSSDRTQWKKWVGEDGKKYGFVESLS